MLSTSTAEITASTSHVGEQRDLAPLVLGQRTVGAAQQDVGLDTDFAQLLDRVLRRLGLDLARRRECRAPA